MSEYITTEEDCRKKIRGVCSQCGGELEPLETVDNSGRPTFWAGCSSCMRFDQGVQPDVYRISARLVDEYGFKYYSHLDERPEDDKETKRYNRGCQISGAGCIVDRVLMYSKEDKENPENRDD